MPRPNQPRNVLAEVHLAQRIASERDRRGWTYAGLAQHMTEVGCAMTASAVHKIENSGRRIVVDELVAFGQVFGLDVNELLLPPAVAARKELARLVLTWSRASEAARTAIFAEDAALDDVQAYMRDHEDVEADLVPVVRAWAESSAPKGSDSAHLDEATDYLMYRFTGSARLHKRWLDRWAPEGTSATGGDRGKHR